MKTETLIIGGGLSGLSLATTLAAQGRDFHLLEARGRFGGRILTRELEDGYFDLGPAWFWPGQPRIDALVSALGLTRFEQHYEGELTFEDAHGSVQRGRGYASMQGSYRVKGGLARLTDALAAGLPKGSATLNRQVTRVTRTKDGISATTANGESYGSQNIVFALPPRIAAAILFDPALPSQTIHAMNTTPTWMAGQAKAVAVYETPFWRQVGLSGDAMSRRGPMVEIHDASPATGGPYALFGFIGVPPLARTDEDKLRADIIAQLVRLFGDQATTPRTLFLKDWAFDLHSATALDQQPLYAHPDYALPTALDGLWDNCLMFAGTEVAPQFGGYLEGALEAAERVAAQLASQPGA